MNRQLISFLLTTAFAVTATAATKTQIDYGNARVKPAALKAANFADFGLGGSEENAKILAELKKEKRSPSSSGKSGMRKLGSEDLMSKELKDFRNELLATRDPETFAALMKRNNDNYESLPNDLKYVIARMSPILPFRGFVWRMANIAERSRLAHEGMLATARTFAEQVKILEGDTQWEAYMAYISIPTADLLKPQADKGDGVKRPTGAFYVENDIVDFMYNDVMKALITAIQRLKRLDPYIMVGKDKSPIVFDNKIRFGDKAFNKQYDAMDRFAIIGKAETNAAIARFWRRIATINQLAAYNWNGNMALRKHIGKKFGYDAIKANFDSDPFALEGVTRKERVEAARSFVKSSGGRTGIKLFDKRGPNSDVMMKDSYKALVQYVEHTEIAWTAIKGEDRSWDMLLDPELFVGREEQIDRSLEGLKSLITGSQVVGAISGTPLNINMKAFFDHPPKNLTDLMPTSFAKHEDLQGLAKVYPTASFPADSSVISMKYDPRTSVKWRNYLYGRATGWDAAAYAGLFPGVTSGGVDDALRTLTETRGARPLMNTMTMFIR